MGFQFLYLCDLLSDIEAFKLHGPPLLAKAAQTKVEQTIIQWFHRHRAIIDSSDNDAVALLSTLLPARRVDRVYGLQPLSLTRVLGRCFNLGISRRLDLERWKVPGCGDLAACVERVLASAEHPKQTGNEVTIEQIDTTLNEIARRSRFSAPTIRKSPANHYHVDVDKELSAIYRRLQSREAKWFTRIILKDYGMVRIPSDLVLRLFHHLLPSLLKVQDSLEMAISLLRSPAMSGFSRAPAPEEAERQKAIAAESIMPVIGIKVGRPHFLKARSIGHASRLAYGRRMSLERKYDGEYAQIHIDLQNIGNIIKIFSKSGKDSTIDREGLHDTLKQCLRIGTADCGFAQKCILEGELVVWSDSESRILEFYNLRKHISRSGLFLGTKKDSQYVKSISNGSPYTDENRPHPAEHLMIVFFDLLLMDDDAVLNKPHSHRRKALRELVTTIPGRSALARREKIEFSSRGAQKRLLHSMAYAFTQKWEGFVLKPSDEPYVNFHFQKAKFPSCWIKLKKDYIPGLGDTAEFAVIGAGYDAAEAANFGNLGLSWTHFHIGCLQNKKEVLTSKAKPKFLVVDAFNYGISENDFTILCQKGAFMAENLHSSGATAVYDILIEEGLSCKVDVLFRKPFVFELAGSGFDRPPNRDYFLVRFPRLVKIHWDRDFTETVSFDELQEMANEARRIPAQEDLLQETAPYIEKLKCADKAVGAELAIWEDSQESEGVTEAFLSQRLCSFGRHANLITAAPFVRMDFSESLENENHLDFGHKSVEPCSSRYATTAASEIMLPTPPVSSAEATRDEYFKQRLDLRIDTSQSLDRKRKRDEKGGQQDITCSKRIQKSVLRKYESQVPSVRRHLLESSRRNVVQKPLDDITNSPQRQRSSPLAAGWLQNEKELTSSFKFGHRMAVGTDTRSYMVGPSCTFQETAVCESSTESAISSPLIADERIAKFMPPSPQALTTASDQITSTASETTVNSVSSSPRPSYPMSIVPVSDDPPLSILAKATDFASALFVLSPCIATTPYLIEDLIPAQQATVAPYQGDPAPFLQPTNVGKTIVILVESRRIDPTTSFLRSTFPIVRRTGKRIMVWDWKLFEKIDDPEARERAWAKCYVGCMWKDECSDEIVMRWRTGEVSRQF